MDGLEPAHVMLNAVAAQPALAITGLGVAYGGEMAVEAVDAAFPIGSMSAIIGPNGAGKSSLMKAVLGLVPLAAGRISLFGESFAAMRQRVAHVPQRAAVDWDFPASVRDVVTMGLYPELGLLGRLNGAQKQRIETSLARVGMADLATRQIGQLSGGQQQRVFIARALAQGADLYLLDEPLAGVDAATETALIDVLRGLVAGGSTVIAVHHDLSTVPDYFDRVLMINRRKIAEGPVASAFTPETIALAFAGRPMPR